MKQFIAADIIIEVYDRYNFDLSVKAFKKVRRAGPDAHEKVYNVNGPCPIPPRKKFLNVSENKQNIIHYLCQYLPVGYEEFTHAHTLREYLVSRRQWKWRRSSQNNT